MLDIALTGLEFDTAREKQHTGPNQMNQNKLVKKSYVFTKKAIIP